MARLARVVAVDVPQHVTQRGNARQFILASDAERLVYLDLLRQAVQVHGLSVIGYCLMSNHVHLVAIPCKPEALALAFKYTHGRYASYWNAGLVAHIYARRGGAPHLPVVGRCGCFRRVPQGRCLRLLKRSISMRIYRAGAAAAKVRTRLCGDCS